MPKREKGLTLKTFTPTTMQANLKDLFDSVENDGFVKIEHRSRNDMVLVDRAFLEKTYNDTESHDKLLIDLLTTK